jgi:protease-4
MKSLAKVLLLLILSSLTGCIGVDLGVLLNPPLVEHELETKGFWPTQKIAVVDISGDITDGDFGFFGGNVTKPTEVTAIFRLIEQDPNVRAILLRINSPGGEVSATDTIYHELMELKRRKGIPVFAACRSLACSGAYYIACAADRIYSQPTTIVGSIGVIARIPNLKELAGKVGYAETIIKSGAMKDMGHPLKDMPVAERKVFQGLVDHHYERFLDCVASARGKKVGSREKLRKTADGRVYTVDDALKLGLVDEVAYLPGVVDKLASQVGLMKYRVVAYRRGYSPDAGFYTQAPQLDRVLRSISGPRHTGFYYLWHPRM